VANATTIKNDAILFASNQKCGYVSCGIENNDREKERTRRERDVKSAS